MRRCHIEDEVEKIDFLNICISEKFHGVITAQRTVETKLDKLFHLTYNSTNYDLFKSELKKLKLEECGSIDAYHETFTERLERVNRCLSKSQKIPQEQVEEYFINGMPRWMQFEVMRLGNHEIDSITNFLKPLELYRANLYKNETSPKGNNMFNQTEGKKPSFASKKFNTIKHQLEGANSSLVHLIGYIEHQQHIILFDTGASSSYISAECIKKLGVKPIKLGKKIKVKMANEEEQSVSHKAVVKITFGGSGSVIYEVSLLVMSNLSENIILGINFMKRNKVEISFQNEEIKIDNQVFEILENGINESAPETLLNEATEIIKQEDIDQFLSKFKKINPNLGYIKDFEFELNLNKNIKIAKKPYSVPLKLIPKLNEHIDDLLKMNIIKKSCSPYGAPAFIKLKPNGDIRLLIDYRELNNITVKEAYPFPNIKDQIADLKGAKVFSQIDLEKGYYQIKIKPTDTHKTAFILPNGQYEFLRMPFGLSNAPRTFQRSMQSLLNGLQFVKIFLDDILIFSPNQETHRLHLEKVFNCLVKANVKINYSKSSFFLNEVKYLGLIINQNGVKCDINKLTEFQKIPSPKNLKQLQKFLGFFNWFRDFVPRISEILIPITSKLKKEQSFTWTQNDEKIKNHLISIIKAQVELKHPDLNSPFELHTDASNMGISAILTQQKKLIGLYSKKLNNAEINYSTVEKELLAVVCGLKHFKNIVWGNQISIFTDSKNITFQNAPSNLRVVRWKLGISEFDYIFKHVEGSKNNGPDFLSRNFTENLEAIQCKSNQHTFKRYRAIKDILNLNHIANEQAKEFEKIPPNESWKLSKETFENIEIFLDKEKRLYIPKSLCDQLISLTHSYLAHPGINRAYKTLHKYIFIPKLKDKIKVFTSKCHECQINKTHGGEKASSQGSLHQVNFNDVVATDIVGPYDTREFRDGGEKYFIISFIDMHSRTIKLSPVKHITSKEIVDGIKKWIENFGYPKCILSDQGKQYTSDLVMEFCKRNKIKKIFSTSYNPTGNSIAERINKVITTSLKCLKQLKFIKAVAKIENAQNMSYHSSIGCSPYEYINKFSMFDPLKRSLTILPCTINKNVAQSKRKLNCEIVPHYKIGDKVAFKNLVSGKLDSNWVGPGSVLEVNQYGNVLRIGFDNKIFTLNIRRVRPYKTREDVM